MIYEFSKINNYLTNFTATDKTLLFISYVDSEHNCEVAKYTYVPEGIESKVTATEVALYSLEKNSSLQDTVNSFNASQNEIYVAYNFCDYSNTKIATNDWSEILLEMDELEIAISGVTGVQDLIKIASVREDDKAIMFDYFRKSDTPLFVPSSILSLMESSNYKKKPCNL